MDVLLSSYRVGEVGCWFMMARHILFLCSSPGSIRSGDQSPYRVPVRGASDAALQQRWGSHAHLRNSRPLIKVILCHGFTQVLTDSRTIGVNPCNRRLMKRGRKRWQGGSFLVVEMLRCAQADASLRSSRCFATLKQMLRYAQADASLC